MPINKEQTIEEIVRRLCHDFESRGIDSFQAQVDVMAALKHREQSLLDRVEKEVIGEDETLFVSGYDQLPDHRVPWSESKLREHNRPKVERNEFRLKQRQSLTTLRKEYEG